MTARTWAPGSEAFAIFLIKMMVSALYILALDFAYRAYLPRFWGSWGFFYFLKSDGDYFLMFIFALIPAAWLRSANTRPSSFFQLILYLLVYVPTIVVSFNAVPILTGRLLMLWTNLLLGSAIIASITNYLPLYLGRLRLPQNHGPILLVFVVAVMLTLVIYANGSNIDIFAFRDIYKHRFAVAKQETFAPAVYSYWWLSGAILPLGLVWSTHTRNFLFFAVCFSLQIVMFGVSASKAAGLTAFATPLVYIFANMFQKSFGIVIISIFSIFVLAAGLFTTNDGMIGIIISTLLARTIGIPGLTAMQYDNFFSTFGYTYWSHVNIVRLFVDYPYSRDIPYEVGMHFYKNDLLSWNANFWASDGIAALGLPGIIIISVFAGITFRVLDQSCKHIDPRVSAAWALTPAMALANVGLFTCLLTDGFGVMILIAFMLPASLSDCIVPDPTGVDRRAKRTP
jgi:hypothetical protein